MASRGLKSIIRRQYLGMKRISYHRWVPRILHSISILEGFADTTETLKAFSVSITDNVMTSYRESPQFIPPNMEDLKRYDVCFLRRR